MSKLRWMLIGIAVVVVSGGLWFGWLQVRPDSCGGVTREFGGCARNQPSFVGTDCVDLGHQYATQVEQRFNRIVNGRDPRSLTYAGAAHQDHMLVALRLQDHLRATNTRCSVQVLYDAASGTFSDDYWQQAPSYIYDDGPGHDDDGPYDIGRAAFEEWLIEDPLALTQWEPEPTP